MRTRATRILLGVALTSLAAPASADVTKAECLRANVSAQALRRDSKLEAARAELRVCADASCPAIVRDDCAVRLDEIDHAQPTVVFDMKDAAGGDVASATVSVDGAPAAPLGGKPLLADPGRHTFMFNAPGASPVERTLVLTEGEKGRRERVVLEAAPAGVSTESAMSARRRLALVTGAVGLAGLIVGGVSGGLAASEESQQKSDCSASTVALCPRYAGAVSAHSASVTDGAISTAGFVAGGALLLGGVILWIAGSPETTKSVVAPTVGPGALGVVWRGEF